MDKHKQATLARIHHHCRCEVDERKPDWSSADIVHADFESSFINTMRHVWIKLHCLNCHEDILQGIPFALNADGTPDDYLVEMATKTLIATISDKTINIGEKWNEQNVTGHLQEILFNSRLIEGEPQTSYLVYIDGKKETFVEKELAEQAFIDGADAFFKNGALSEDEVDKFFPVKTMEDAMTLANFILTSRGIPLYGYYTATTEFERLTA